MMKRHLAVLVRSARLGLGKLANYNRKIKRRQLTKTKKDLSRKVSDILNVPDQCSMCDKPFDKTDKQMAMTWSIVVRKQKGETRLYCPPCWELGQKMAKEFLEEKTDVE